MANPSKDYIQNKYTFAAACTGIEMHSSPQYLAAAHGLARTLNYKSD